MGAVIFDYKIYTKMRNISVIIFGLNKGVTHYVIPAKSEHLSIYNISAFLALQIKIYMWKYAKPMFVQGYHRVIISKCRAP